ncbi:MAG TPA: TetR/AcrR family transcriptional regulator [Ktedonobacteraceae bacterium]
MSDPEPRRGRVHDAEGAREAILNAAEAVFAEHGFDGARIDVIAKASGYNSSLLFHYFGDKIGLYVEVVKRADREMTELQGRVLAPLLEDETVASNVHAFKALLEIIVAALFDYLVEHPRFMRMLLWEQAEGWQTFSRTVSQFDTEDADQFEVLFRKAREAGLLRSDFAPLIQLSMVLQICLSYLTFIPLYQMVLRPGEDLFSAAALARAREYLVAFVVHGMMIDLPETRP